VGRRMRDGCIFPCPCPRLEPCGLLLFDYSFLIHSVFGSRSHYQTLSTVGVGNRLVVGAEPHWIYHTV
jgi:hypothetical protein